MASRIEIGIGLAFTGLGALGWVVHPLAYASLGIGILLIIHGCREWWMKRSGIQYPVTQSDAEGQLTSERLLVARREGFTNVEMDQLLITCDAMAAVHGHQDLSGLIDDMKNGRPLNGTCWLCGEPRFHNGESDDSS